MKLLLFLQKMLNSARVTDFLALLALRLYLAPVLWMAGTSKLADMESTIEWFGIPDWGLGLPFPESMAWLATTTEIVGALMLVLGQRSNLPLWNQSVGNCFGTEFIISGFLS